MLIDIRSQANCFYKEKKISSFTCKNKGFIFTILENHSNAILVVDPGIVRFNSEDGQKWLYTIGGILFIKNNHLNFLSNLIYNNIEEIKLELSYIENGLCSEILNKLIKL